MRSLRRRNRTSLPKRGAGICPRGLSDVSDSCAASAPVDRMLRSVLRRTPDVRRAWQQPAPTIGGNMNESKHVHSIREHRNSASERCCTRSLARSQPASLVAVSAADARITRIQITTRTTAFGGYSLARRRPVREDRRHGVRRGRSERSARTRSSSTSCSRRATRSGKVEYSLDFYILKPIDLTKGDHKVMYEPPNRGGKTWTRSTARVGGNDPATHHRPDGAARTRS